MGEPRVFTLAFRVTASERKRIDVLAERDGVSPSEYTRRAALAAVEHSEAATADAREEGRQDMQPRIVELEARLARAGAALQASELRAAELMARLVQAPDELMAAAIGVIAGGPGAQEAVAIAWSRIGYTRRLRVLPIIAAAVHKQVQRILNGLYVDADVGAILDLVERSEWLIDNLSPDAGLLEGSRPSRALREWAPLKGRLHDAVEVLRKLPSASSEFPQPTTDITNGTDAPGYSITPRGEGSAPLH